MSTRTGWTLPLFVPGTRPDRFGKAAASGADAIIVDLEDAVDPPNKDAARANLAAIAGLSVPVIVRINAAGTKWHDADLAAVASSAAAAIMLPKAESVDEVASAYRRSGQKPVVAIIETALGVSTIAALAKAPGVVQLAFGTQDLSAELGCDPSSPLFDVIRLDLLLGSRRAGIAPPLDGVCLLISDIEGLNASGARLGKIGFAGQLCIHPAQIAAVAMGMMPSAETIEIAEKIVASGNDIARVGDIMVDGPVRRNAEQLIAKAGALAAMLSKPSSPTGVVR